MIIALFGVMNTLYLSIYERTRELGLRAVGLTRRQTRSMVRWEAVIISIMGACSASDRDPVRAGRCSRRSRPRGSASSDPGRAARLLRGVAAVLGVVFAIFPARRAAKLNVLEAISYE